MKNLMFALTSALLSVLIPQTSFAGPKVNFPVGLEPILNCPATKKAPRFDVVRNENSYFLVFEGKTGLQTAALEADDADAGYVTYVAVNEKALGKLAKYVFRVDVYNNEEGIENPDDALIRGGQLRTQKPSARGQECFVIGSPKLNT